VFKVLKKVSYLFLIVVMLLVNFFMPKDIDIAEAKTLRDLKQELEQKEQEYKNSQNEKELTEAEIASIRKNIDAINTEISNIQVEMLELTKEIEELNEKIIQKDKEIKSIMNYYQLSNGESAYLEYIFNAVDFTDFIYRLAIAEQLSNYNDKLIEEYNIIIKENEAKKVELNEKTVALNEKQSSLQVELKSLKGNLESIVEENMSIEDEIEVLKEYEKEKTFNRFNLFQYFTRHKLKEMIDCVGDF
jgi:peptidoglycan hydrolase CwlO-like protein